MEQVFIHLDQKIITLNFEELGENIDLDALTNIHYWNLPGEAISISTLLNKVGIMKAQAEHEFNESKLDFEVYEADLRRMKRKEAVLNGGKIKLDNTDVKLTEKLLDEVIILDAGWQQTKSQMLSKQKVLSIVDSLFWATNSKSKKLEVLMKGIKPEEFENEIVEEFVNGMMIKKFDKKLS